MSDPRKGERIRTNSDLHASFMDPVIPSGTEGKVTNVRHELFDSYVQVDFDNGAQADIPMDDFRGQSFNRPEGF